MSSRKAQQQPSPPSSVGTVVRCGYLRKCGSVISRIKPLKKKYFVLRSDAPGYPACIEYYDSKKKFENKHPPKRSIILRTCYNINRRSDTKQKYVIALYTKIDCFSMILDNEKDLVEWLTAMLLLSGDAPDGEPPKPHFEHVWEVTMENEGLGEKNNCHGPWRVCLTDRVLTLIKLGAEDDSDCLEFPLTTVRLIGLSEWSKTTFVIQVGRSSITGEGEFLMTFEDPNIAQNMHDVIMAAMLKSSRNITRAERTDDLGPQGRMRSCSANEASKPISVLGGRRPTGHKLHGFSPLEEQRCHEDENDPEQSATTSAPSQSSCQSQNSSSTNTLTVVAGTRSLGTYSNGGATSKRRRHSLASQPISTTNKSQSIFVTSTSIITNAVPTTTTTTTTTNNTITTTATKSHQRTLSLPLAAVVINQMQSSKRSVLRCPAGRDRCDSLPSRARTTSEGLPAPMILAHPRTGHLAPHPTRPHSMYSRGLSYSPPISSMPISPASGACSTDSAGSSLSMDDGTDSMLEESVTTRYGHSLTPEEPVILEENSDEYVPWSSNNQQLKYSPNFKSHSPSQQSSYVDMYSPCGSSPGRGCGIYLPMSPATTVHSHSRASSLVEEATLPDGYVPMAPVGDDGYVDMDPANISHNGHHHYNDDISQHGSSCSVTSGTPSTDLRFIEYTLDKVPSFITPSDDVLSRPTRAYSVGSRPEPANRHRKNRLDIAQQEASRVRAFSVGSRSKRPELSRLVNVITARLPSGTENVNPNKSNSAPLLSSSWGHNSGCSVNSERMADLMEMDFTKTNVTTTLSSTPSSYTQSHSYSTVTDTSSYVDMSPGQLHTAAIHRSYVDMSGANKVNRINNNNITTANHNHNHIHTTTTTNVSTVAHKPVIKTLKPVVESESPYMMMSNSPSNDWSKTESSKQQSPALDDYMEMNAPPGMIRTAPVDLPQPRKPIDGYVEMSFKPRPNLEQNYINMTIGTSSNNARTRRKQRLGSRKDKSQRSQPIAIQASNKPTKAPSFLPLNGSSTSGSLESTPATPPAHATPTGSNATIFPFSLNSPQSPIKPFASRDEKPKSPPTSSDCSPEDGGDYAAMTPRSLSTPIETNSMEGNSENISKSPPTTPPPETVKINSIPTQQESPISPLSKRLTELAVTLKKTTRNSTSPVTICPVSSSSMNSSACKEENTRTNTETTKSLKREREHDKVPSSPVGKDQKGSQHELPQSPVMKKLSELSVSKAKLIGSSPNISPTPPPPTGLKAAGAAVKNISTKVPDDSTGSTPTATPAPSPSPLDSEGYEKLQPGATLLHYASLDLPESSSAPPVSPTPVQDGFRYAEIDFAKLKQN